MHSKIICTGNPNCCGIAQSISAIFPNVYFVSRSTGYDLAVDAGRKKFQEVIKHYNVFINVSQVVPGTQEALLTITRNSWDSGHVFNIGSTAEYTKWEWFDPAYTDEKRKLKELSIDLCSENFKTTHMTVGGFKDTTNSSQDRMDPAEIANVIKWILESNLHIPVIGVEKIFDKKVEAWMARKVS
jgi:hypothetical protein